MRKLSNIWPSSFVALILLTFVAESLAQTAITSTGGGATGSGGSFTYAVGQATYITNSGTTGSESQGVTIGFPIDDTFTVDELHNVIRIAFALQALTPPKEESSARRRGNTAALFGD